jgi:hypothetical protein
MDIVFFLGVLHSVRREFAEDVSESFVDSISVSAHSPIHFYIRQQPTTLVILILTWPVKMGPTAISETSLANLSRT